MIWIYKYECYCFRNVQPVKGVSVQFKPDGGTDLDIYVSYLFLNMDAPSMEVKGQAAEEMYENHIILCRPVNLCPPIPGILTDQGEQV